MICITQRKKRRRRKKKKTQEKESTYSVTWKYLEALGLRGPDKNHSISLFFIFSFSSFSSFLQFLKFYNSCNSGQFLLPLVLLYYCNSFALLAPLFDTSHLAFYPNHLAKHLKTTLKPPSNHSQSPSHPQLASIYFTVSIISYC
ncbi:hypothetical protein ACN38_g10458 [Penicillium nordicum]|uniref:Uncharacterized protein n=1 Tax=Penicillium nordicum TaxID=229535 RepID=A0A0M8NWE7_9EURO|nr:hypothetical protein ACN38_g10458 [Penicillium nordicum]